MILFYSKLHPTGVLTLGNFKVKVSHVKGDLRKRACLDLVCEGVTAVFHTASIVDTSFLQDTEYITSVNVEGEVTRLLSTYIALSAQEGHAFSAPVELSREIGILKIHLLVRCVTLC